ncbi:MAG: Ig-like domain-containing protein, partial [Deltaproteobacteria bacterium]|nr:Ig-like domain-containing protein [Deltaproteobacteria bacterium]
MKKTYFYGTVLFLMIVTGLFVLVSCGGGGGSGNVDSPDVPAGEEGAGEGGGGSAPASVPASISLATSQVEVKSDNSDSAIITATVLDENNAVVEGARVSFSADGGQLSKSAVDTDENGEAQT